MLSSTTPPAPAPLPRGGAAGWFWRPWGCSASCSCFVSARLPDAAGDAPGGLEVLRVRMRLCPGATFVLGPPLFSAAHLKAESSF